MIRIIIFCRKYVLPTISFFNYRDSGAALKDESITINVGSGSDILWLSDANETVNTGLGDDEVIINGGNDTIGSIIQAHMTNKTAIVVYLTTRHCACSLGLATSVYAFTLSQANSMPQQMQT